MARFVLRLIGSISLSVIRQVLFLGGFWFSDTCSLCLLELTKALAHAILSFETFGGATRDCGYQQGPPVASVRQDVSHRLHKSLVVLLRWLLGFCHVVW
jgi:hypothetical protein